MKKQHLIILGLSQFMTSFAWAIGGPPPPVDKPMCRVFKDPGPKSTVEPTLSSDTEGVIDVAINGEINEMSYVRVGSMRIADGDIILTDDDHPGVFEKGNIITTAGRKWPGGVMPCEIDASFPNQQRVWDAIKYWHANTPFRLVPRKDSDKNFVRFVPIAATSACYSYVGMMGNMQKIQIPTSCGKNEIAHEIGHAVGLFHEHNRVDRDTYVEVLLGNVHDQFKSAFDRTIGTGVIKTGAYDYNSLMHYRSTAFSKNGQPTMRSRTNTPVPTKNGSALSNGDKAAIKTIYGW